MSGRSQRTQTISLGKRKLKVDEFASIINSSTSLFELNSAAAEQLKADSSKPLPPSPVELLDEKFDTSSSVLSSVVTRAIILFRAQNFLQDKACVRPQIVQFLVDLLSNNICPVLPERPASGSTADANKVILAALAACFNPNNSTTSCVIFPATTSDESARVSFIEACAKANVTIPTLNNYERKRFLLGIVPTQAQFILAASSSLPLLRLADSAAALSCEAAMVFTEPFQQTHYDFARPYATAVESASVLRWMLDGSVNVNKRPLPSKDPKTGKQPDGRWFRYIPAVHATLRDATAQAVNTARVDLNSAEAQGSPLEWQHPGGLTAETITQSARQLFHAYMETLSSSVRRTLDVVNGASATDSPIGPLVAPFSAFPSTNEAKSEDTSDPSSSAINAFVDLIRTETNNLQSTIAMIRDVYKPTSDTEGVVSGDTLTDPINYGLTVPTAVVKACKAAADVRFFFFFFILSLSFCLSELHFS